MSAAQNHQETAGAADRETGGGVSLPTAILWLWRWRWLLGISSSLFAILAGAFWVLRGESVATAMLKIPGGATSPYGALAAQLGISSPTVAQSDPVEFYVKLLDTRVLLTQVVRARYRSEDNKPVSYADAVRVHGDNPGQTERRALSDLRKRIGVSADDVASTITLTVSARSGVLAEQIARNLLSAINDFNIRRRQSSAGNERRFAESRLVEARGELRAAQDAIEQFAISNKAFAQSAAQQLHSQRLQAEIDIRQRLVAMLEQAFEQAKLDEVRDTPVITEIDPPEGSAARRLSLAVTLVIGALLGFVGGVAVALGVTLARLDRRRHPQEWAAMTATLPRRRQRGRVSEPTSKE